MHPHGTSIGFGFTMNGAIRFKTGDLRTYLPDEISSLLTPKRISDINGVQAPVLFNIPLLRAALLWFGCCTPATKTDMFRLFGKRHDFGIMPGGMEEVALYEQGRDRVYLKKRAGFISKW